MSEFAYFVVQRSGHPSICLLCAASSSGLSSGRGSNLEWKGHGVRIWLRGNVIDKLTFVGGSALAISDAWALAFLAVFSRAGLPTGVSSLLSLSFVISTYIPISQ
jgi:hypothetical protein